MLFVVLFQDCFYFESLLVLGFIFYIENFGVYYYFLKWVNYYYFRGIGKSFYFFKERFVFMGVQV